MAVTTLEVVLTIVISVITVVVVVGLLLGVRVLRRLEAAGAAPASDDTSRQADIDHRTQSLTALRAVTDAARASSTAAVASSAAARSAVRDCVR